MHELELPPDEPWGSIYPDTKRRMHRFVVEFDNSKRRDRRLRYQKLQAEGILFGASRHVFLDTQEIKPAHDSYRAMAAYLLAFGKFSMLWIDSPPDEEL